MSKALSLTVIYWTVEVLLRIQGNGKELLYFMCISILLFKLQWYFVVTDECCYIYGSIANDRNNCVPEGRQFNLNFIIYNPHDNFTNLTVRWFRNTAATVNMLIDDELSTTMLGDFPLSIHELTGNCSSDLYRDTFMLSIVNFTIDQNGYYWCQLVINDTYHAQPSTGAWFYADVFNSTHCNRSQHYFKLATSNEEQCAQFINATSTKMSPNPTQTNTLLTVSSMDISSVSCSYPLSQTCSSSQSDRKMILYIAGGTGALLLICGVLIGISLSLCLCKVQKKKSKYTRTIGFL